MPTPSSSTWRVSPSAVSQFFPMFEFSLVLQSARPSRAIIFDEFRRNEQRSAEKFAIAGLCDCPLVYWRVV